MSLLFDVVLNIDPPKVTHHQKTLGLRNGKGGKLIPTMRDKPELEQAQAMIAMGLHRSTVRAGSKPRRPIQAKVIMDVSFCFRSDIIEYWGNTPDRDNLAKTLQDVMTRNGWFDDDRLIVGGIVEKGCGPEPFIRVVCELADDEAWREIYETVRPTIAQAVV